VWSLILRLRNPLSKRRYYIAATSPILPVSPIFGTIIAKLAVLATGAVTTRTSLKRIEQRIDHMEKLHAAWGWIVFFVAILVTIGFCNNALAADRWTCRTGPMRVIKVGDRFSVVLMKCGAPDAKYKETTDEGAVIKEEWIYHGKDVYLGHYNFILTFEEGRLVKIERESD
jgi:hypothetical protein